MMVMTHDERIERILLDLLTVTDTARAILVKLPELILKYDPGMELTPIEVHEIVAFVLDVRSVQTTPHPRFTWWRGFFPLQHAMALWRYR